MLKHPSPERNKAHILEILKQYITPAQSSDTKLHALEIASGTGQHVSYFASEYGNIEWQPTDVDPSCMASVRAYIEHCKLSERVRNPIYLDCSLPPQQWADGSLHDQYDLIYTSNLIHISPYKVTEGLVAGAANKLAHQGKLIMYGPFAKDGVITPESNVAFDQSLRRSNPEWGYRDITELAALAKSHGLMLKGEHDMPANNKMLVFVK